MQQTYLFYDIETSGLNKAFDQVLQFAAIRTDLALNEIERSSFLVQPSIDVIPSPQATVTHHVSIAQGQCAEFDEYQALTCIHQMLNQPGTISLGYNTLGFDDEFLRFSFWRHLLTPYTHQYANQCARMDIYPMTILYALYKPDILSWPQREANRSLKLADLSVANQLAEGPAHDALVDVEATVALARKLHQDNSMWRYLCGLFDKQVEQQHLNKLPSLLQTTTRAYPIGLMILGKFGAQAQYQAPVLGLGQHWHYRNQTCWLRLDQPQLIHTQANDIGQNTWVMRKKAAEPGFILPYTSRYIQHSDVEREQVIKENLRWCQHNGAILDKIAQYHLDDTYVPVPEADAGAQLYQAGFPSNADQRACQAFHQAPVQKKLAALAQIDHPLLREMGVRLLGKFMPAQLGVAEQDQFQEYLAAIWQAKPDNAMVDYRRQPRLTVLAAQQAIDTLQQSGQMDDRQQTLLVELADYLKVTQLQVVQ